MSIIARLLTEVTDSQVMMARDLLAIAIADGQVTPEEKEAISAICAMENIDEAQLMEAFHGNKANVDQTVLRTRQEKMEYMRNLIKLIGADGYTSPHEAHVFQIIASRIGLTQRDVLTLFLSTTTHQYFKGATGTKVLNSFIQNFIDPKGKTETDNRKCLRTIYDTVANRIDSQDKAQYTERLRHSFARTSNVFLTNKILIKEFEDIGVDFYIMVKQEELRALKKYIPD